MVEMLDIYDENLKHIGVKSRSDVHRDGDWHRVFHCWVMYRDDAGEDWVVMQKRAASKLTYPNYLDVSASGHYEAGESAADGVRELWEELGLAVPFEELIPAGRRVSAARYGELLDYEVADVFFYICDQALEAYSYQHEELAGLVALNIRQTLPLFDHRVPSVQALATGFASPTVAISLDDFIPNQDHYVQKVMILARQCLDGMRSLFI